MSDDDSPSDRSPEPEEKAQRMPPPRVPPGALDLARWSSSRRYAVVTPFAVVGFTDLEFPVAYRARAAGFFEAAAGYEAVRDVFRLYHNAGSGDHDLLRRFVRERDALGLTLQDGGTLPLAATIELISEWGGGRMVIHVAIQDERYWRSKGRPMRRPN